MKDKLPAIPIQSLTQKSSSFDYQNLIFEFFEDYSSEHTKRNYAKDLQQFVQFMRDFFPALKSWHELERFHAVAFKKYLSEFELSPKSVNRKLSSLSSFCRFLLDKNLLANNPFASIKRPKQEVIHPTSDLTDVEVGLLLQIADMDIGPSKYLHRAVLYLLFSTGLRKAEIINAKRKDLRVVDHIVTLTVRAKGGRQLEKLIHPKCYEVLLEYFLWMKECSRDVHDEDWIFQPSKNPLDGNLVKPMNPKSIDYILENYVKKAGITKNISPHSARATYIGSALDQGVDLYRIAQDVGHQSVKTTEEYNKRKRRLKDSPAMHLPYLKKAS